MTPATDAAREARVHNAHCYQGEYKGVCKYGDPNCPAALTEAASQPREGDVYDVKCQCVDVLGPDLDCGKCIGSGYYTLRIPQRPPEQVGAGATPSEWPTAEQLEAEGKAPWQGEQPIQQHAKMRRGRQWVPLEAAEAELQFWQRRDFQHTAALRAHEIALANMRRQLEQHSTALINTHAMLSAAPTPPDAGPGEIPAAMVEGQQ